MSDDDETIQSNLNNVEILSAELPSRRQEAQNVAEMFGTTSNNQVDWEEFLIALNPDWANEPQCIADAVHEEVRRLVMMCTCRQKFRVFQVGEGKYRVRVFGMSKLKLYNISYLALCFSSALNRNFVSFAFSEAPSWFGE